MGQSFRLTDRNRDRRILNLILGVILEDGRGVDMQFHLPTLILHSLVPV